MSWEQQLAEAIQSRDEARARFETAKPNSKKRLEAAEELEFWTSKKAYLAVAIERGH